MGSRTHFLEATEFTPSGPPCQEWLDGDRWTTDPEQVNCLSCQRILAAQGAPPAPATGAGKPRP